MSSTDPKTLRYLPVEAIRVQFLDTVIEDGLNIAGQCEWAWRPIFRQLKMLNWEFAKESTSKLWSRVWFHNHIGLETR
jgi:hypothetical protein